MPCCNNENQEPVIVGFHIHLSDFEKIIFDTILPYILFRKEASSQVVVLSYISFLYQLKERKEIRNAVIILQK